MLPRFLAFPLLAATLHALLILRWDEWSWGWRVVVILLDAYCWFCVGGSFHEAAHQTLFRSPRANLWWGRVVGTFIGIPYSVYRETHRSHHAYLNTAADFELWPYSSPCVPKWVRRVFVWLDIVGGVVTAPLIYGRIAFVRPSRITPQARRAIVGEYLALMIVWGGVLGVLLTLLHRGHLQWSDLNPLWLLPLVLSPAMNTLRKFQEHLGLSSTDPVLGTRTVIGPGLLTRLLSYFNFDISIHGPHHRYPRARHDELPDRLREWRSRAPTDLHPPVFATFWGAWRDMLPCLWRCPAVGEVVLRDLGRTEAIPSSPKTPGRAAVLEMHEWDRVAEGG